MPQEIGQVKFDFEKETPKYLKYFAKEPDIIGILYLSKAKMKEDKPQKLLIIIAKEE